MAKAAPVVKDRNGNRFIACPGYLADRFTRAYRRDPKTRLCPMDETHGMFKKPEEYHCTPDGNAVPIRMVEQYEQIDRWYAAASK